MNFEQNQGENKSKVQQREQYENENQHDIKTSNEIENEIESRGENENENENENETKNEIETHVVYETKAETNTMTNTRNKCDSQLQNVTKSYPPKQATSRTLSEKGLSCQFYDYTLQSKVLFSGIGADELCGGYVRYQTAFTNGGRKACWEEMTKDWNRLWIRNLVVC